MLLFSTILDINKSLTKDVFVRLVIDWNRRNPHPDGVIQNIQWKGEKSFRYGEEGLWLGIEEYQNIIAIRYEKKEEDGSIWDTDFVMNFNLMKMAIQIERSYSAEALSTNNGFSTPYFITLLIKQGYLKTDHKLQIQNEPIKINAKNIKLLTDVINNKTQYSLPVIYVSKTYYDNDPVNVNHLANRLKGVAHVMVEQGNWLNPTLKEKCGGKNEYNGAIGIYFPMYNHRRYLYRITDRFLLEKVVKSVIKYCTSQTVDSLLTWQGINNVLLKNSIANQRKECLAAKAAQKVAEDKATEILNSLDERRKQAFEEAQSEANKILDSFDDDMQKLQNQMESLTRENEILRFENQGLKKKIDTMDLAPVLVMGNECDLYTGEIKDIILSTLSDALDRIHPKSRRADIIRDIIKNNDYHKLSNTKAEEIKKLLKDYNVTSTRTQQGLKDLGFDLTEDGKHYRATYYGDERYKTTFSKTPSDNRSGKNSVQQTINLFF